MILKWLSQSIQIKGMYGYPGLLKHNIGTYKLTVLIIIFHHLRQLENRNSVLKAPTITLNHYTYVHDKNIISFVSLNIHQLNFDGEYGGKHK